MKYKRFVNYARLFEWIFGTILMVTLGVIAILPLLNEYNRWVLIIGLFLYFVASLARMIDDAKTM